MIINFKVRNMTIEAVPCFDPIRQGSEDILRVAFEFDETWDEFTTKYIYFASEGYAEFFELIGNEYDVPKYYAAQEYFAIQLSGHNGTAKIPTNKIVVTLDPSGEIWTSEPPECMAEGIQRLIDAAEEAKSKADEAKKKVDDIITADGRLNAREVNAESATVEKIILKNDINGMEAQMETETLDEPVLALYGRDGDQAVRINNVANPKKSKDAANKDYVDEQAKKFGGTKIPIVDEIPADAKDGDMFVLRRGGDDVPAPDYGNIPGGSVPDGEYVTEDEMKAYVNKAIGGIQLNETDPTVPAWAKAKEKPSYAASEIAANVTIDEQQCKNVDEALNALANRSVGGGSGEIYSDLELIVEHTVTAEEAATASITFTKEKYPLINSQKLILCIIQKPDSTPKTAWFSLKCGSVEAINATEGNWNYYRLVADASNGIWLQNTNSGTNINVSAFLAPSYYFSSAVTKGFRNKPFKDYTSMTLSSYTAFLPENTTIKIYGGKV